MLEALRVPFDLPIAVAAGFLDCIKHSKVRIPLQRRTLTLLQIQMARSAAFRRGVTIFNLPLCGGGRKGVSEEAARLKPLLPIKAAMRLRRARTSLQADRT